MYKYRLIVDSSCDLQDDFYTQYNIGVTDLIISFGEREYIDRKEITTKELLEKIDKEKIFPKTSALNIMDLEEIFKKELELYDHIFYMPISSNISSIYNNALLAVKDMNAEDKISVLDSSSLSSGIALLAIGIAEDIQNGLDYKQIEANHIERSKKVSMSFVIDTMDFLHKGGRCSGLTYIIGNKFHIHPIIRLDNGKMTVHTLIRDKDITKGVKKMVDEFNQEFEKDNIDFSYPIFIPHVEGVYGVKKIIKELEDKVGKKILLPVEASGIICCHCGRDTVGLGYMLKNPLKH